MSATESGLSTIEHAKLENYEEIISDGLQTCFDVGRALLAIRDERLYRLSHSTFEAYCQEKWNLARRTAYQYIDAAEVVENVRNCAQIEPANEAQARPLAKLPPEDQPAAWQEAVEESGGKPTAKGVEAAVNKRLGKTTAISLFVCPKCAETFTDEVWHCTDCGHHWPIEIDECSNCRSNGTESSPQKTSDDFNEEMAGEVLYDDLCAVMEKHKLKWKFGRDAFTDACFKAATFSKSLWRAKR